MELVCDLCGFHITNVDEIGKVVHPYHDKKGYYMIIRKYGKLTRVEKKPLVICKYCYHRFDLKNRRDEPLPEGWRELR